jgi:hypothetical protein
VGVLGAVLAVRTQSALAQLVAASPGATKAVDAHFMASLLAGDLADALRTLDSSVVPLLSHAAPLAFAQGFSWALLISGVFALVAAVAVKLLADARDV